MFPEQDHERHQNFLQSLMHNCKVHLDVELVSVSKSTVFQFQFRLSLFLAVLIIALSIH